MKSIRTNIFKSLVVLMRVLFGTGWFLAGLTKITGKPGEVSWFSEPDTFLTLYLKKALNKPNVPDFYKYFIKNFVLHHVDFFNYTIPVIQIIAGVCMVVGLMTIPVICICLFMQINFIISGNMNVLSLTLYTSAFGLLFCTKDAFILSVDRVLKWERLFQVSPNQSEQTSSFGKATAS